MGTFPRLVCLQAGTRSARRRGPSFSNGLHFGIYLYPCGRPLDTHTDINAVHLTSFLGSICIRVGNHWTPTRIQIDPILLACKCELRCLKRTQFSYCLGGIEFWKRTQARSEISRRK